MKGIQKSTIQLICITLALVATGCAYTPENYIDTGDSATLENSLHARFFGTSTLLIRDGQSSILIDGFFTRQSLTRHIINRMKPNECLIDRTLQRAKLKNVDILLVSHSHYDHALDSEVSANKTGATLMGSQTTLDLFPSAKNKRLIIDGDKFDGDDFDIEPFTVSVIKSPHVQKGRGKRIVEKLFLLSSDGYRFHEAGDSFSFYISHPQANILIVPSASFPKTIATSKLKANVVFLSIGLLGDVEPELIKDYWIATVVNTGAKLVIPIHFDDFRKPLENPLTVTPNYIDNIAKTMRILNKLNEDEEVTKSPVKLLFPPVIEPFSLDVSRHVMLPIKEKY